jgi:hypothetical protein
MRTAMMRGPRLLRILLGVAALALVCAGPMLLSQVQGGLWEVTGAPGTKQPVRICLADVASLARFEHRGKDCSAKILKTAASSTWIDYDCRVAGFGHSQIEILTPRSLRIDTQGISNGLPFAYVLQARRIGDCPAAQPLQHH